MMPETAIPGKSLGESLPTAANRKTLLEPYRLVLVIVCASESILFGTMLSAFLFTRSANEAAAAGTGQPGRLVLPVVNTVILLISLLFAGLAARSASRNSQAGLRTALWATLALGLIFLVGQAYEFIHSGMSLAGPSLGGITFALISFHGMHVIAGIILTSLILLRSYLGDFTGGKAGPVQDGAWFWVYVTAVWLVLFVALFLL